MNAEAVFRAKAPGIMAKLLSDFPIAVEDAAAIVGNAGHESLGFTKLQEMKPTVPGSRGGWGWMQWTGPRRRAFEAYCKRTGKDPASDDANYAWLFLELSGIEGTEGKAISKTVAADGLNNKVEAFEKAFLRAGVKHYPSRKLWAKRALDAYHAAQGVQPGKIEDNIIHGPSGGIQIRPKPYAPSQPTTEPAKARKPVPKWIYAAVAIAFFGALAFIAFNVRF